MSDVASAPQGGLEWDACSGLPSAAKVAKGISGGSPEDPPKAPLTPWALGGRQQSLHPRGTNDGRTLNELQEGADLAENTALCSVRPPWYRPRPSVSPPRAYPPAPAPSLLLDGSSYRTLPSSHRRSCRSPLPRSRPNVWASWADWRLC